MKCKRCGEELEPEDFRRLRLQYTGVCKACEHYEAYERELLVRERRADRKRAEAAAGAPAFHFVS